MLVRKTNHYENSCLDAIEDLVVSLVDQYWTNGKKPEYWDIEGLVDRVKFQFNHGSLADLPRSRERYMEHIYYAVEKPYKAKVDDVNSNQEGLMHQLEKQLYLQQIDQLWKDHLTTMDQLRTGIGLRGYGQRDPKKEYQKEGYRLFSSLLVDIKSKLMGQLFRIQIEDEAEVLAAQEAYRQRMEEQQRQMQMLSSENAGGEDASNESAQAPQRRRVAPVRRERPKIGRNELCWCGSGKKYKKCHMASDNAGLTGPGMPVASADEDSGNNEVTS